MNFQFVLRKATEHIFSEQRKEGYWVSTRITDPRSLNTDSTAMILEALLSAGCSEQDPRIMASIDYLLSQQNLDGGWSDLRKEPSRPTITSYVLWALGKSSFRNSTEVDKGVGWLEERQAPDGGWAEITQRPWEHGIHPDENQPWITSCCIRALANCPQTKKRTFKSSLSFLRNTQCKDGSWEGGMETDMVLIAYKELGLTVQEEAVSRGINYMLSFQARDGSITNPWHGPALPFTIVLLNRFFELGLPMSDGKISKTIMYLQNQKIEIEKLLQTTTDLKLIKSLKNLEKKFGIALEP